MIHYSAFDLSNHYYHVYNRGVNKQNLFFDDHDRWTFLYTLKSAKEKYQIKIHAFYLMDNHYHLIIFTQKDNLSLAMQFIGQCYAQYYLKKYKDLKKDGHAFRGRFGRKIVDTNNYASHLLSYIHLNGYKDGLSKNPEKDKWSSYSFYKTGKDHFGFLEEGIFKKHFSPFQIREKKLVISEDVLNWDPSDYSIGGIILGNKDFARKIYEDEVKNKLKEPDQIKYKKLLGLARKIEPKEIGNLVSNLNIDNKSKLHLLAFSMANWSDMNSEEISKLLNINAPSIRYSIKKVRKEIESKQKSPLRESLKLIQDLTLLREY